MPKTPFLLLFLIGWPPAYAVCDKACNTPFQCDERESCQFRDITVADMAITLERLMTEYKAKLADASQALMNEYQTRLKRNQIIQALELTKTARDSFGKSQASMAATWKKLMAQYQADLTTTTNALIDEYQTRLNAFEQAYTNKMAAETELTRLARESVEKDAHQIRAVLTELSASYPWREAISELKADIQAQQAEIQRLTADNQAQQAEIQRLTEVDNKHVQVAEQLSKQLTDVENRQTTEELSKRLTEMEDDEYRQIWSSPSNVFRDRFKDGTFGPEMIVMKPGLFRMGDIQSSGGRTEQPIHSVFIRSFAMGHYEVTFAEYDKFAQATGRNKPSDNDSGRDNHPVINVSWDDATAYAQWLSEQTGHQYRLPTEAEWEYTARAGTDTKYWWGNDIGSNNANCYQKHCGDNYQTTAPVGTFAANPFGLFDTVGNVWEWTCSEYQDRYTGKEQRCAEEGSLRVLRGGAWSDWPRFVRAANRNGGSRGYRSDGVGFRLARLP